MSPRGMPPKDEAQAAQAALEQAMRDQGLQPQPQIEFTPEPEPPAEEPDPAYTGEQVQVELELPNIKASPREARLEKRRSMPKHRSGTYRHPYPTDDGRDTIKTSFSLDRPAREQLDTFFALLGPGTRNRWAERVLLAGMRHSLRAMQRRGDLRAHAVVKVLRALPPDAEGEGED